MGNRSEFHGDVGQAVLGNVNEAPRLSNIVNLNIADAPKQAITSLQRGAINAKVKEVVAACDVSQLDVYRVLLTEFGAEKMDFFPRDHYKDAVVMLDTWISEATAAPHTPVNQVAEPAHRNISTPPCTRCAEQARHASQARRMMSIQTVTMLLLTGVFGWLLWNTPANAIQKAPAQCYVDGKPHSVGSTAKMADGALKECLSRDTGVYWAAVQKSTPLKTRSNGN